MIDQTLPETAMHAQTTDSAGPTEKRAVSFELLQSVVRLLEPYSPEEQRHVLQTVSTWLRLEEVPTGSVASSSLAVPTAGAGSDKNNEHYRFSGRREASPKEFLLEKEPKTDVERLACLAYYLTHYRDQSYFKTDDLSKLNIEAAQRAFSNPSFTAKNAWRDGFLVPAPKKGFRQLSALGEQYVQTLPDHDAARHLRKRMFRTRANRSRRGANTQVVGAESEE